MRMVGLIATLVWMLPCLAVAEDLHATTADGRAVVLHSDGTWAFEVATGPASDLKVDTPPLHFSVATCGDFEGYISVQMTLRNDGKATLGRAEIKFTYLDQEGALLDASHWTFSTVRAGKAVTDRTLAIRNVTCSDISKIEVTSVECRSAEESVYRDCFNTLSVGSGALPVMK